ncbi:MAG: hypothetical protein Q9227_002164 [Pyrenula ochraceoflavens]
MKKLITVSTTEPLGAEEREAKARKDFASIMDQEFWHALMDCILDDIKGPTADVLRLERYANWSEKYEQRLRNYCLEISHEGDDSTLIMETFVASNWRNWLQDRFAERCRAKQAFRPWPLIKEPPVELSSELAIWYQEPGETLENCVSADMWWKYYAAGVQGRWSLAYAVNVEYPPHNL